MAAYSLEGNDGFLVMDDPLVNLDPRRQQAAAECINEFARDNQGLSLRVILLMPGCWEEERSGLNYRGAHETRRGPTADTGHIPGMLLRRSTHIMITALCMAAFPPPQAPGQQTPPAYLNPSLDVSDRVRDLLSRMTLEEKAAQWVHNARPFRLGSPLRPVSEGRHGVARAGYQQSSSGNRDGRHLGHEPRNNRDHIGDEARAKHHDFVRYGDGR
jgi:hypothetical protein